MPDPSDAPEAVFPDSTTQVPSWAPSPPPAFKSEPVPEPEPEHEPKESRPKQRTICGLVPAVFILLVTLAVVIIAAAVGGGVGGSMAVKNARSRGYREGVTVGWNRCPTAYPSSTTTTTSEPSASPTTETGYQPPDDVVLALNCPSLTGDMTSTKLGAHTYDFDSECGVDRTGDGIVIIGVMAYSFEHCLRACGAYNRYDNNDSKCLAITFFANLTSIDDSFSGNCYLKNAQGSRKPFDASERTTTISALLVEDD
ncbi:uncharacterized protein F5Z01DRAFT_677878 [Emericellopsis atlantica]|uniref:Apple domain-containing protein n=1 Tax=Emericellopsis atlantica TaxID=2614577 RepID=A0A9P8CKF9_9HYPO|nr:uncharacterized protein F5Z01DRAFT_677878 [Emericellopsis atlantica]KAG9250318.1 hypothetical protein F5Z01DRAFT_677878 [Emericellopsis atlantica]